MRQRLFRGGRLLSLVTLVAGLLLSQSLIAAASARTARAEIEDFTTDAGIQANVSFMDSGPAQGLAVTGSGSGFQANGVYVSLIYDVGSVAENVTARGIGPCDPTIPPGQPGFLNGPKMFVGFWLPIGSTSRSLSARKTSNGNQTAVPPGFPLPFIDPFSGENFLAGNTFTPVGTFATISVRRLDAGFSLNECGAVMSTGAKTASAAIAGFGVDTGIEAAITFVDNGPAAGLVVTGSGTGFRRDGVYVSLIYDINSVQEGVSAAGTGPCEPAILRPSQTGFLTFQQMVVGFWLNPDGSGRGTGSTTRILKAVKTVNGNTTAVPPEFMPPPGPDPRVGNTYAAIGTFATISVRRADAGFALHACGDVEAKD